MPLPDYAFDFYQIDFWDDMRYRVRRMHVSGKSSQTNHHYLSRDPGGAWTWSADRDQSESWEAVQNACLSLSEALTQHGVIG